MIERDLGPPPLVDSWRSLARLAKVGRLFHRPSIAAQQAVLQVDDKIIVESTRFDPPVE